MMNSTTAKSIAGPGRVLTISVLLQAAVLLALWLVEPLRTTRLTPTESDLRALDEQAAQRWKEREQAIDRERAERPLPAAEQARRDRAEQERRERIEQERTDELRTVHTDIVRAAAILREEIEARTLAELGAPLADELIPLATQLVVRASEQARAMPLDPAPSVLAASIALRDLALAAPDLLRDSEARPRLDAAFAELQARQHAFIIALDRAQQNYAGDEDRIRRENHLEYGVNLARDLIADLLRRYPSLDPTTMNVLPEGDAWADSSSMEMEADADATFAAIATAFAQVRAADRAITGHSSLRDALARSPADGLASPPSAAPPGSATSPAHLDALVRRARAMGEAAHRMAGTSPSRQTTGSPAAAGGPEPARRAAAAQAARGLGSSGRYADLTAFQIGGGRGERGFSGNTAGGGDLTEASIRSGYRESGPGTPGARDALLDEQRVIAQALPGRSISRSSPRTGWLYLDTWYLIGPWENHGRIDFEKLHPPETFIDLDATHTGKHGLPLRWTFHQSGTIRIKPFPEMESATYYAYTEVHADEDLELLLAVASDDAAKVWIGDTLVWQDGGNSPWRLDEGFRRVRLRKGFNPVLVRLENGPIACTFSLMLCPPEVLNMP
jgi:hypothetical protein